MSLKDDFAQRGLPREEFPLRMDFGEESEAAEREFVRVSRELAEARAQGLVDLGGLQRRVEQARVEREKFYRFLVMQAMPPREFDDLIGEHPATDEQKAKAKAAKRPEPIWSPDTFMPALLERSVTDVRYSDGTVKPSDMTADDWAELTSKGPVASGEAGALFAAAMQVNDRTPDPTVGKG